MCVCVCVFKKTPKKLLLLTHHSCPAEILSVSGTVSLFFTDIFFLSAEILEEARQDRSHVRILPDRKREWLMLFFRKHHQRQTHEVKVSHIFCLSLVCFYKRGNWFLKPKGVQFSRGNKANFNYPTGENAEVKAHSGCSAAPWLRQGPNGIPDVLPSMVNLSGESEAWVYHAGWEACYSCHFKQDKWVTQAFTSSYIFMTLQRSIFDLLATR